MKEFKNATYVYGTTALNLQLFADANVNTTGSEGMSKEMRDFYDKALIRMAAPNLVHDQFGQKRPIPKNGGKTIQFRKYDSLGRITESLEEGVTPKGQSMTVSEVLATVDQYGGFVTISDMLSMTAIDNNIVEATRLIADQASKTLDRIVREVLCGYESVFFGGGKKLREELTSADVLTPELVFKAVAELRAQNAPTIDGKYVAIIHPYVAYDFMRETEKEWINVNKYANATAIYNGEIGEYGGVRFVMTSEAKVWESTGGAVFSTIVLGRDAYGSTEITGGGLQHIVKQLGEGDDPLNQRATVGWKATKTAALLVPQYIVGIETGSAFSATAEAN